MDFQQLLSNEMKLIMNVNESISLSSAYYHSTQNISSNYLLYSIVLKVLKSILILSTSIKRTALQPILESNKDSEKR